MAGSRERASARDNAHHLPERCCKEMGETSLQSASERASLPRPGVDRQWLEDNEPTDNARRVHACLAGSASGPRFASPRGDGGQSLPRCHRHASQASSLSI